MALGVGLPVQLLGFPSHASAQTGTINIIKNTVGGDGTFNFSGGLGAFALNTVGGTAQRPFNVAPGTYAVTEAATAGFSLTSLVCNDPSGGTTTSGSTATIALAAGETVTCTYTNSAQGTINIIKNTVGGDGTFNFSGDLGAFALNTVGGTAQRSFNVAPGTYAVTEAATAGFSLTSLVCNDPSGGTTTSGSTATIALAAGETVTCTYTNPANGTINIIKNTVGGDGTFNFSGGLGAFALNTSGGTASRSFNVAPGTYAVTEAATAGFGLTGLVCNDPSGGTTTSGSTATIALAAGETVTCTYTNSAQGTINIIKNTVGGDGVFNFTGGLGSFDITTVGATGQQSFSRPAGTFAVTEAAVAGFDLTSLQCTDPSGGTTTAGSTATIALAAGETVTCTYTNTAQGTITIVKNTVGGDGIFNFTGDFGSFDITTVGATGQQSFSRPAGTFAVTEAAVAGFDLTSLQCTDPSGGTTTAGSTATIALAAGETVTCTYTNSAQGMITIVKNTVGGDGTFNFIGDLGSFSLATSGGTAQQVFSRPSGTFAVTEVVADATSAGFHLTDLQCSDPSGGTTTSGATATIALAAGESVSCTYTDRNVRKETLDRVRTFLHRRADLLLEADPDRSRLLRRLSGSNGVSSAGAGFAGGFATPFSLIASGDSNAQKLSFSTSLSQLARSSSAAKAEKLRESLGRAMALGQMHAAAKPAAASYGIDIWVEGHYTGFDDDTGGADRNGHLGVVYVGADRLVRPGLLFGLLAQYDWADDDSALLGSDVDGSGWMVGPYVSARLKENLFFDVRGAWGESDNDIVLAGLATGSFDTERWLARARLTGHWQRGAFRVSPSVSVKYIEENQESFTNSLGIFIPSQSVTLGRLSFGPEFGYRHETAGGTLIEPQASITALWDFDDTGTVSTLVDTVASADDFRAKLEGGVMVTRPNGVSLRAMGSYDGIGDDEFEAYGGKLWLSVPLQSRN